MVTKTNEQGLEEHIESWLLDNEGYRLSRPGDFNREFCIDEVHFWNFLESTQKEELDKLRDRPNYQRLILERLKRRLKKDTIAGVLKKGLAIDNANFSLLYRLPYNDLNPEVIKRFDANIFSIARQIHYSESEPLLSVDMVLFVNGMALATFELKNPWTGQNVYHAREQYKKDRDPKEPLFQFGKCLVHFALDPNEVFMATRLAGKATYFLPFNKGFNNGKGNPPNASGMKSSYLWQEILGKKSLTNILEHFAKYTKDEKGQEVLFFPRYHQLDVVRKIMVHSKENGTGQTYLIQHSAGSGKSNSITWLSYQLIEQYDQSGTKNIFDSVIVVTDRRILDKQIRNNIKLFSEVKNIVAHAESAADLKQYLEAGKKLIITTIQKFPFIVDGMADLSSRNFAVIIDEAHSSQSGKAADKLNMSLGDDNPEIEDWQDKILATMEGRKMLGNSSYFAFTATPKNATLEKFGWQATDGSFHPFHLYSMKQAIEEGFILDVLAKYTTYKSYYSIQKSIDDNPLFDTAKAQKKLRAYVEGHKETIKVKARIMVDHFIANIFQGKKMKGKAKAMVVTRNIECALRYFFAIREELVANNVPFKALVAFSGTKTLDGVDHTEDSINGFASKDIGRCQHTFRLN
jgi:type I restriction enzyme R subunit